MYYVLSSHLNNLNISQKRSASLQSSDGEEDVQPETPVQLSNLKCATKLERSVGEKSESPV